ncbi:Centrosomal protein of 19kDa [Trypanosoma melophagium]|uniref:Centrosomal protein of 19kDa n=1 Tax=Trypanosoma melophagium TaxID=715481 RepID=UPI00351A10F3|nr:Centrosomal protein of 19kDa [Trypanosoma melophagium]
MTSLQDLGLELWVLVYHLYAKYTDLPKTAFRQLALRTRCACAGEDLQIATRPSLLKNTQWFREMSERYKALRQSLRESNKESVKEAAELTRSFYPTGCSVSEYADALQTCAAMLSKTIPSETLSRFIKSRLEELASLGQESLTVDELISDLIERPLLDALTPSQWWQRDTSVDGAPSLKSVMLRSRPPQIDILYLGRGKLRCQHIHLVGILHEDSPTAPLAKRLARTHGALLSEDQFRTYLLRLQSLMKGTIDGGSKNKSSSDVALPSLHSDYHDNQEHHQWTSAPDTKLSETTGKSNEIENRTFSTTTTTAAASSTPKGNKADVGLLYRDPDAAMDNVDLNDADDVTLQEFKAKMNEKFMEKIVRPGDPDYVYDKRVDVKPTERSEWDDSD